MSETRELAAFAAALRYEDLPKAVRDRVPIYLLDNLAAGFVGSAQPWARMVRDMARALSGTPEASMFNQDWKADVSRAALVNGAMMGAFETEHIGYNSHPSGTAFPAALAMAEKVRADGKSFIAAMIAGYEVVARIGAAQTPATERERGFHNPGVNGPFGAAVAAGKLLGLDEERIGRAMGIAGSCSSGLTEFAWQGDMTKRLHLGLAARGGVESALLAQLGFTGPLTVLEGRYGYLNAVSPSPKPERLTANLGIEWLCLDLVLKAYACHVTSQPIVHAIRLLRHEVTIEPSEVRRVLILGEPHAAAARYQDNEPRSIMGCQYSMPFNTAVAFCRDMADPLVMNEETMNDPAVRALAKKVEMRGHERFHEGASPVAEITIELDGGGKHTIQAEDFPGSPGRPLDVEGARDKFQRYAGAVISRGQAERVREAAERTEQSRDVSELAGMIGAQG